MLQIINIREIIEQTATSTIASTTPALLSLWHLRNNDQNFLKGNSMNLYLLKSSFLFTYLSHANSLIQNHILPIYRSSFDIDKKSSSSQSNSVHTQFTNSQVLNSSNCSNKDIDSLIAEIEKLRSENSELVSNKYSKNVSKLILLSKE